MMKKYVMMGAMLLSVPAFAVIGRFGGSLNTSDPEKVFIRIKNSEASATAGTGALMAIDTAANDGVSMKLTTAAGQEVSCVASAAIAAGKFGLCQVYGYIPSLLLSVGTETVSAGGRLAASSATTGKASGTGAGMSIGVAYSAATTGITSIPAFLKLQ